MLTVDVDVHWAERSLMPYVKARKNKNKNLTIVVPA